jgi:hypothetical protein
VAKKAKTPPPPRKVQAPRTRTGAAPRDERRSRMILYGAAVSGLLALAVVLIVVLTSGGGGGDKDVAALMKAAGCDYKTVDGSIPKGQSNHVNSLTADLHWNTFPPSNGQHYPEWAVWGFYEKAVNPRMVVHNLEHGGVVLWWGPQTPPATVAKLNDLYSEDPSGMFGTPLAGFGSKVGISAWTGDPARYMRTGYYGKGHVAVCEDYTAKTKKAFEAFRDSFVGNGPEGVPLSADQPGMGPQSAMAGG